jgi:hypothetical protein
VFLGVLEKKDVLLGSAMLLGRERERLERWNEVIEKRRFFFSSLGLTVSLVLLGMLFSTVVDIEVVLRVAVDTNSGSSEAWREEGMESDRA